MADYVAFLRGINLGRRRLKMERLREVFTELGFDAVETFIASGNVSFSSSVRTAARLEATIAAHLEKSLGYAVDTFIRTRAEVATIATARPFAAADFDHPDHSAYVLMLRAPLTGTQTAQLKACRTPVDEFAVEGREIYWLCRIRMSESTVWAQPAMKAVKLPEKNTMRNLTTMRKIAALYPPSAK